MTLHFSQIGFTEDLTFIVIPLSKNKSEQSCRIILTNRQLLVKQILCSVQILFQKLFLFQYNVSFSRPPLKLPPLEQPDVGIVLFYLSLQMILPLERSYGESSIVTLSPGRMRM